MMMKEEMFYKNWENYAAREMKALKSLYTRMISSDFEDTESRCFLRKEILSYRKEDGSFRLINLNAESDLQIAYVYFPTYYATAALMNFSKVEGLDEELLSIISESLSFILPLRLNGHGFDSEAERLEALSIFKKAGLYEWLDKYQDKFPQFREMIVGIIENYRSRLARHQCTGDWSVDFTDQFRKEVEEYDLSMTRQVWYAAYGSNLKYERLMKYIARCTEKTAPKASKPIQIPHPLYFAGNSKNGKAVAFIDSSAPGKTFGRMYLITSTQLSEIQRMEGSKYTNKVLLGYEDGIPVYSFTSPEKRKDIGSPSDEYLNIILDGLRETYAELSELTRRVYLFSKNVISKDGRIVLEFIRKSKHGVTLQDIAQNTVPITRVRKAVNTLVSYKLIRQDRRNHAEGIRITDSQAIVYTEKEAREMIDILMVLD